MTQSNISPIYFIGVSWPISAILANNIAPILEICYIWEILIQYWHEIFVLFIANVFNAEPIILQYPSFITNVKSANALLL